MFHWRIQAIFRGGAQLHFKGLQFLIIAPSYLASHLPLGSRDPYHIIGVGAGFDFRWDGNVTLKVGYRNDENELIQLTSNSMVITIPKCVFMILKI